SPMQLAAGAEEFSVNLMGYLQEKLTGKTVSDADLEDRESRYPDLKKARRLQADVHDLGNQVHPEARERGFAAAPLTEQILMMAAEPLAGMLLPLDALKAELGALVQSMREALARLVRSVPANVRQYLMTARNARILRTLSFEVKGAKSGAAVLRE